MPILGQWEQAREAVPEHVVSVMPSREQFDRFARIIADADARGSVDASTRVIAAMLLACLSWLHVALGRDEAARIYRAFGDEFVRNLDRKGQ